MQRILKGKNLSEIFTFSLKKVTEFRQKVKADEPCHYADRLLPIYQLVLIVQIAAHIAMFVSQVVCTNCRCYSLGFSAKISESRNKCS